MSIRLIQLIVATSVIVLLGFGDANAACINQNDLDSAGNRCGGRAASVIPGGTFGGNGQYVDSQGRDRMYGSNNDSYDSGYGGNTSNGTGGSLLGGDTSGGTGRNLLGGNASGGGFGRSLGR